MNKKAWFLGLRIVLTAVLVGVLYYLLDWGEVWGVVKLSSADVSFWIGLFLAVIASVCVLLFAGFNVWLLTTWTGHKLKKSQALLVVVKMFGASMFLPSRSGDLTMMYYLRNYGVGDSESVAVFMLDRIIYFFVICGLALVGLALFFFDSVGWIELLLLALALVVLVPSGIWFGAKLLRWGFKRFFKKKVDAFPFIIQYLKHPKLIVTNLLVNGLRWCCRAAIFYWLFAAMGFTIPFFAIVLLISIEVFITFVPLTIMGLGLREVFAVWAYPLLFGVSAGITFVVYALSLFIAYAEAIIICLIVGVER